MFVRIAIEGLLWSCMWTVLLAVQVRVFPWSIEHDYPQKVRRAAEFPPPSAARRRAGRLFSVMGFGLVCGALMAIGLMRARGGEASFADIFLHLWAICMTWNVFDLLVVDWLGICALRLTWLSLPGTEGHEGNVDYGFHFRGFLRGLVPMTVFALVFSGLDCALLGLLSDS